MTGRGFAPITASLGALLVWAAHFGAVYVANAIACERGLARLAVAGLPLVPVAVLGLTALALGAVALIGLRARRRLEHGLAGQEGEDAPRFLPWFTLATALLAGLAILWEAVPALIVEPCG